MDELDAPGDPEELYRDRGDVPVTVPLMQGDVFDGITVPGLSDDPITVQVVMHPCSMREAGGQLRERVTAAPVGVLRGGYSGKLWATRNVNQMLLPALREDITHYAAEFLECGSGVLGCFGVGATDRDAVECGRGAATPTHGLLDDAASRAETDFR